MLWAKCFVLYIFTRYISNFKAYETSLDFTYAWIWARNVTVCGSFFSYDFIRFELFRANSHENFNQNVLNFYPYLNLQNARVSFYPCRPSRSPNGQCLLGIILLGAWNPTWRNLAIWKSPQHWWRWLFFNLLCRDRSWKTRSQGSLCRFGTFRCW